jgi:conjugative transfer signal peptidase TraF
MHKARARGYLRFGLCEGLVAPLIKTVVATAGQAIQISDVARVDGRPLPHSRVSGVDGQGREMTPYDGGVVPPGTVFLHSEFPGSFDSRYFGPLSMNGILGLAQEVWTYAP